MRTANMKLVLSVVGLVCLLSLLIFASVRYFTALSVKKSNTSSRTDELRSTMSNDGYSKKTSALESSFVCNTSALNDDERRQHKAVVEKLRALVRSTDELPDGYALRFDSGKENILLLSEFIAREKLCCPFFGFDLVVEPESGPLWLRLRGREGVKTFIRHQMRIQ